MLQNEKNSNQQASPGSKGVSVLELISNDFEDKVQVQIEQTVQQNIDKFLFKTSSLNNSKDKIKEIWTQRFAAPNM